MDELREFIAACETKETERLLTGMLDVLERNMEYFIQKPGSSGKEAYFILDILVDKAALAPLRKKNSMPIASLITTIGISQIIQNLLTIIYGSQRRSFPALFDF